MGTCYENGSGCIKDSTKAVDCFKKSSALGDSGGSYHLGYHYLTSGINNNK